MLRVAALSFPIKRVKSLLAKPKTFPTVPIAALKKKLAVDATRPIALNVASIGPTIASVLCPRSDSKKSLIGVNKVFRVSKKVAIPPDSVRAFVNSANIIATSPRAVAILGSVSFSPTSPKILTASCNFPARIPTPSLSPSFAICLAISPIKPATAKAFSEAFLKYSSSLFCPSALLVKSLNFCEPSTMALRSISPPLPGPVAALPMSIRPLAMLPIIFPIFLAASLAVSKVFANSPVFSLAIMLSFQDPVIFSIQRPNSVIKGLAALRSVKNPV